MVPQNAVNSKTFIMVCIPIITLQISEFNTAVNCFNILRMLVYLSYVFVAFYFLAICAEKTPFESLKHSLNARYVESANIQLHVSLLISITCRNDLTFRSEIVIFPVQVNMFHNGNSNNGTRMDVTVEECQSTLEIGKFLCPKFGYHWNCNLYTSIGYKIASCNDMTEGIVWL